ncbi:ANTH domain-containing protein [Tricharina praecox]|uniref:ANTH domain-containing protein n=1 Tax=Tricharina praecox TaxID=43433 RepID=UPI00221E8621|nr:ANTH domain-containing protein [Tricharina praecox]KAI5844705.1 ANTH domain-containing protein [Tricharina praecox]
MSYSGTRNVDMSRSESDLVINIKKATNIEETAPKRKHVRSCIVYTWDHKSSQSFWAGMKVQPIMADEVQTFKALITVHKVLQEGHPVSIREAQFHAGWIETLGRGVIGDGIRGYGPLIREYIHFLRAKLQFHRYHPEFNGLFEYEEYISLKSTNDPNEGYETISDLMTLQDQIETFQKLVFSHFRHGMNNECRISSLVPLVQESYGIYKFITSMLRAMHIITTGDDEALAPLRQRYEGQHHRLVRFYYECSSVRYLTSLITIPRLPQDPPNLTSEEDAPPTLPKRPVAPKETPAPTPPPPPPPAAPEPESIDDFWSNAQAIEDHNAEQERLRQQRELEQQQQMAMLMQQQQDFEEQQRMLAEQQRLAEQQLIRDQYARQAQGHVAELERQLLDLQGQQNNNRLLLESYDNKVKALENEISNLNLNSQQLHESKESLIQSLTAQANLWKSKYDALAKIYSQLRHEHLDLLGKFKQLQLKASSAQEAIDKREKLEREMKSKNLELADMIRERDRALYDLDRVKGSQKDEVETLKRELRMAEEKSNNQDSSKGRELSAMLSRHNREMADLEELLRSKQRQIDDLNSRTSDLSEDLKRQLKDKEEELEVYKAGMDQVLLEVNEQKMAAGQEPKMDDELMDTLLLEHLKRLHEIIDSVLQSGVQRIDDALYELESPMNAGNQNATAGYLLSQIEKAAFSATEFATTFNNFIADGPSSHQSLIIKNVTTFSSAIADVLFNSKGVTRFISDERKIETLISAARQSADYGIKFFQNLQSFRLDDLSADQKADIVITNNLEVQASLQKLTKLTEQYVGTGSKITDVKKDIGEHVDSELGKAAAAIEAAAARLAQLQNKSKDGYSTYELRIHESILEAAIAVTNAIAQLIKAATISQQEIVAKGKGGSSRAAFYKRNNRWTEGLISASKAVASSTNMLIETADGVISGRNKLEQMIVASNEVAASTAQLVAASRVKADFMSKSQERLEGASKAVTYACKSLVRQVQSIIAAKNREEGDDDNWAELSGHEFKVQEMEQQVEILQLENKLNAARMRLGEMRKHSYAQQDED